MNNQENLKEAFLRIGWCKANKNKTIKFKVDMIEYFIHGNNTVERFTDYNSEIIISGDKLMIFGRQTDKEKKFSVEYKSNHTITLFITKRRIGIYDSVLHWSTTAKEWEIERRLQKLNMLLKEF